MTNLEKNGPEVLVMEVSIVANTQRETSNTVPVG